MKKLLLLASIFLMSAFPVFAQVAINTDNTAPDGSAMLDVKSITKGVLVPRMTAAQRDAIASPATGLMIFCTDNNQYYYNQGTPAAKNWVMVNSQWLANGSSIYYNAGNVGIGTSAPTAILDINSNGVVKIRGGAYLQLDAHSAGDKFGYLSSAGNTAGTGLKFETSPPGLTNGLVRMTITNEGKIGIGSTSPDAKLTIGTPGATYTDYGITSDSRICVVNGSGNRGAMILMSGGTYGVLGAYNYGTSTTMPISILPDGGNVGIGISNPSYKLDIGNGPLGPYAGNTVTWLRLFGTSNNLDQLRIYHYRYSVGGDWTTAETRIQKTIDNVDMHYISFKGGLSNGVGSLVFGYQNTEQMVIESDGNIGIGTSNPEESAALDVSSTARGFLPPRMTAAEINAIAYPSEGLIVYNTSDKHIYVYTSPPNNWERLDYGSPMTCGVPFTVTHIAGTVAPVTKKVTYGTVLTGLTGANRCWITQNLGADNQATSATDATEASAGWYWQFNRQQGYMHDGTTRIPNTTWITTIVENSDWQTDNDPCLLLLGPGWRLPTNTEWNNVDANGGWNNYNDTYGSVLKLHAAGSLSNTNGSRIFMGTHGIYWSSSNEYYDFAYYLVFSDTYCNMNYQFKSRGETIRCLRD